MAVSIVILLLFGLGALFIFTAVNKRARRWVVRNHAFWKLSKSDEEREGFEAGSMGVSIIIGIFLIGVAIVILVRSIFE